MSQYHLFLTGLTLSLLLGIAVVAYIRKPLYLILVDLCGTEDRARFWAQITNLSFMLVVMLAAFTYRPGSVNPNYYYLTEHLGRTLIGLLVVTCFLAMTISRFIRRKDKLMLSAGKQSGS